MLRFFSRVVVRKGMPVIAGVHLGVLFHQKGSYKLGNKYAFKRTEKGLSIGPHPSRGENHVAGIHCRGRPSARSVSCCGEIFLKKLRIISSNSSDWLASQHFFVKRREK